MRSNNHTENQSTDLNTLTHPLVLFSIVVLLINDHVLKIYSPSWFTGKLSDFAGLFFFPILLSAILNIICKPLNVKQSRVTLAAFGFTALWFSLIKTLPFFSHLTETFLSRLLSYPSRIICDPTDLIALIVLLPAWKLRTISEKQSGVKNIKLSYLVLCVASIASLATGPAAPPQRVDQLVVYENTIYAHLDFHDPETFYSSDGGKTWAEGKSNLPTQVMDSFKEPRKLPITICLPDNPAICYRTDQESIVQTLDGGKTWNTSWNIPLVQRRFIGYSSPSINFNLGPYDLTFLEFDGKQVFVAAMGVEGVLVKTGDGPWESVGINGLGPIPYKESNLKDALGIVFTELYLTSLTFIILLFLNVLVNIKKTDNKDFAQLKIAAMISIISLIVAVFSYFVPFFGMILLAFVGIVFAVSVLATILFSFQQSLTNLNKQGVGGLVALIMMWLTSCVLFVLWVYDIVHEYRMVLLIVVVLYVGYLIWLFYQLLIRVTQPRLPENS